MSKSLIVASVALCGFPIVAQAAPPVGVAAGFRELRIHRAVQSWADASEMLQTLDDRLRDRLLRRRLLGYSAHALLLAAEFHGPVSASDLRKRFRFTAIRADARSIQLTAAPRDSLDRLFVREFHLRLDAKTWLPNEIAFVTGAGKRQAGVMIFPRNKPSRIRLVKSTRIVKPSRPAWSPAILRVSTRRAPLDPKVERVLKKWSSATADLKNATAKFTMHEYDTTFNIERRGLGMFQLEPPSQFVMTIAPVKIAAGTKSPRIDRVTRTPYKLEPAASETWVGEANAVKWIRQGMKPVLFKTFDRGQAGFSSPFSGRFINVSVRHHPRVAPTFLAYPDFESLANLYRWEITKEAKGHVWLAGFPLTTNGTMNVKKVTLELKTSNWRPSAVQLIGPAGSRETVYVFHGWKTVKKK